MIIDFHTHTFPAKTSVRILETLSESGHVRYFTNGSIDDVIESMKISGVDACVNLPVMTRPDQTEKINASLIARSAELFEKGVITFGGMHPLYENYKEEISKLKAAGIKGVKLHSAFSKININDIRYKRIIDAVSEAGMVTIIHGGEDVSFIGENYASVPQILDVIEDVRPEKFVIAHMGGWQAWDEVKRDLAGAPVYIDTSFSLGPVNIKPGHEDKMPYKNNLDKTAFESLVRSHGADKVLFGTDSPWADQKEYIEFINKSGLTGEEKEKILGKNAEELLK